MNATTGPYAAATECRPTCGCKARDAADALAAAMSQAGMTPKYADTKTSARTVAYLLREFGWEITRREKCGQS